MHKFKLLLLSVIFISECVLTYAAVPSGYYYFAQNKKNAALKTALHDYGAALHLLDYGGGQGFTWEGFYYTDNRNDTVVDMYSNIVRVFNGFNAVDGMNIEHSFPKSWWGASKVNAYMDLFHLYPADDITNITKSNWPLGEVTGTPSLDNGVSKIGTNGFETAYTDKCFEPADEYKGDFARSYFYISTIYQDYANLWQSPMMDNNTYPVWKPWAIDLLMKWSKQDPVSPKELARQEAVYKIQGNRNPFIDYPDLADYIWGADTTQVYPFPQETEPFLVSPRAGTAIDFGVILQNDSKTLNLHLMGVNLNADIQFSLAKNRGSLSVVTPVVPVANALAGVDVGITFHPVIAGLTIDTLLLQGGGLATVLKIPVKALASADFITVPPTNVTPVGGTLNWISDPQATDYKLSLYQGDKVAGDLIISTYVEGSSWNKALEIYNGTGKTVDLSKYSIQKQSDGSGSFGYTLQLTGTLNNNQSYTLVNSQCGTPELVAKAQRLDSLINFNGNDAVALVRSGVIIDEIGIADAGASVDWGKDVTFMRKADITHPVTVFNPNEWETLPVDSYSMLGNHMMNLASDNTFILQNISTGNVTSYAVQNLYPENTYTYSVEAVRSDGDATAINTMQIHTSALDVPVMMEAGNVRANQFTANWEETLYASGYLLNIFKLEGKADTTETEGFDNVGSSGTPLPTGWIGTASGNYTTTTSSGVAAPSVAFKNAGEWLQTKAYPQPVSKLAFMYRFATYVAGASMYLDGSNDGIWTRIDSIPCKNNSKVNTEYNFTKDQNYTAFKFTFNKMPGGNFALDDVAATYGSLDTIFVQKDVPVTSTSAEVTGLDANTSYYYNVRATLGNSVSALSDAVLVQTLLNDKILETKNSDIELINGWDNVVVSGLKGNEMIQVYSLTGICLYQQKALTDQVQIPLKGNGIYIVRIQNQYNTFTAKILK